MKKEPSGSESVRELEDLQARLAEAEEVIRAIRNGDVDAVLVAGEQGDQVYTLSGADVAYRQLIENMSEGAATLSTDGVILYANARLAEMLELPIDRIFGTNLRTYLSPEDQQALDAILFKERITTIRREINIKTSYGHFIPVFISASLLQNEGTAIAFCLVFTDLTEKKKNEQIIADERLSRLIMSQAAEAIVVCDTQGMVIRASLAAMRLCEGSPLFMPFSEKFHLQIKTSEPFQLNQVLNGETLRNLDVSLARQAETLDLIMNAGPLVNDRSILGCVLTLTDITERKRAEEALLKSEDLFRISFEKANVGKALLDLDGKFTRVNETFCSQLGYEQSEVEGRSLSEFTHPDDVNVTREMASNLRTGERASDRRERRYIHKDGHIVWADVSIILIRDTISGEPLFFVGHIVDISERKQAEAEQKKLEEQLRTAQRMDAIGSLAGGIAHDFNNLLSVILSYTGFLMKAIPEGDPSRSDLLEVKQAAERAATLTHQLLAFSRKQVLQPLQLDLNEIVKGIRKMLERILGEDIELSYSLNADLGFVLADPSQIEQVLMNLVVNARDAMPEGGKLTIETSNEAIDDVSSAQHANMAPGGYVMLAVSDSGYGMDKQTQARIFEPFFTTKGLGKGTGLGLSTVYGIVKQSGGFIWVYSELGLGTTFKIYLPRISAPLAAVASAPMKETIRPAGTETILLVEDEEAMRKATKRILDGAGFTVLVASDGVDALQVSARHSEEINLLLTDVVMPHMGGKALAQALIETRPLLKVIYMSGYTDDAIINHGVLETGTNFIGKPFTEDSLIRKVQEVIKGVVTDVADSTDEPKQTLKNDAEIQRQPLNKDALWTLPAGLLEKLEKAVIAARFDEIVEIAENIRTIDSELANALQRMTECFDYDGLRGVLRR